MHLYTEHVGMYESTNYHCSCQSDEGGCWQHLALRVWPSECEQSRSVYRALHPGPVSLSLKQAKHNTTHEWTVENFKGRKMQHIMLCKGRTKFCRFSSKSLHQERRKKIEDLIITRFGKNQLFLLTWSTVTKGIFTIYMQKILKKNQLNLSQWCKNLLYNSSSRALTFPLCLIKQMVFPLMSVFVLLEPSTAIPAK